MITNGAYTMKSGFQVILQLIKNYEKQVKLMMGSLNLRKGIVSHTKYIHALLFSFRHLSKLVTLHFS
jgi:hypothetical protein